jgi:hypothetical protein
MGRKAIKQTALFVLKRYHKIDIKTTEYFTYKLKTKWGFLT